MDKIYVIHSGDVPLRCNTIFVGSMEMFYDNFGEQDIHNFAQETGCVVTEQDHLWLTDEKEHPDNV